LRGELEAVMGGAPPWKLAEENTRGPEAEPSRARRDARSAVVQLVRE
jgi:hypothetical protein